MEKMTFTWDPKEDTPTEKEAMELFVKTVIDYYEVLCLVLRNKGTARSMVAEQLTNMVTKNLTKD